MAIDEATGVVSNLPPELVTQISFLLKIIGALGGIIILYLIFNTVMFFINRKKSKQIDQILTEVKEINKKLSKKK